MSSNGFSKSMLLDPEECKIQGMNESERQIIIKILWMFGKNNRIIKV